jgi:thioredoxin-related protein
MPVNRLNMVFVTAWATVLTTLWAAFVVNFLFVPLAIAEEPELGDNGLYHTSWFLDSFLELRDDVEETTAKGKRFAIFWELKGCPYCKETHFTNLTRDDISEFMQANFEVIQLNFLGSRMVVDIDGEELTEKQLRNKYGIRYTPTIQFFDTDVETMAKLKPKQREIARLQGYLKPEHFLAMLRYVQSGAYETMSFRKYLKVQR